MRVAAIAGDRVDRLDLLGAELEEQLHGPRHDLVLAHARAQHAVDLVVDRVDDRGRMLEQRDLLRCLDRAGPHHHGLGVGRLDALALQRVERLHVGQVDPQRLAGEPAVGELAVDASGERIRHARLARHRPAHRGDAGLPARLGEPRRVELVMLRRRAEVPEHRIALAREQHASRALVSRPFPDVRARDVADVVLVEEEHRAERGVPQRRTRLLQPVAPEPGEVDPLLPVDRHRRAARGDVHRRAPPSSSVSSRRVVVVTLAWRLFINDKHNRIERSKLVCCMLKHWEAASYKGDAVTVQAASAALVHDDRAAALRSLITHL